jgi:hypothetical protein
VAAFLLLSEVECKIVFSRQFQHNSTSELRPITGISQARLPRPSSLNGCAGEPSTHELEEKASVFALNGCDGEPSIMSLK